MSSTMVRAALSLLNPLESKTGRGETTAPLRGRQPAARFYSSTFLQAQSSKGFKKCHPCVARDDLLVSIGVSARGDGDGSRGWGTKLLKLLLALFHLSYIHRATFSSVRH